MTAVQGLETEPATEAAPAGRGQAVGAALLTIARRLASAIVTLAVIVVPPGLSGPEKKTVILLADEVGFRPHYDIAAGLIDTIGWWRQQQPR